MVWQAEESGPWPCTYSGVDRDESRHYATGYCDRKQELPFSGQKMEEVAQLVAAAVRNVIEFVEFFTAG